MPPRRSKQSKWTGISKTRRLGCCNSKQKKRLRRFVCVSPDDSAEEIDAVENAPELVEMEGIGEVREVQVEDVLVQQNGNIEDAKNNEPDDSGSESDSSIDSLHLSHLWPEGHNAQEENPPPSPAEVLESPKKFSIPKAPFKRVSQEVLHEIKPGLKFRGLALEALQVAAEGYLIGIFTDCSKSSALRKSSTVTLQDLSLVLDIRASASLPFGSPPKRNDSTLSGSGDESLQPGSSSD